MKKYFIVDVGRFTSMAGPSEEDLPRVLEMARNPNWIVALYDQTPGPMILYTLVSCIKFHDFWSGAV